MNEMPTRCCPVYIYIYTRTIDPRSDYRLAAILHIDKRSELVLNVTSGSVQSIRR